MARFKTLIQILLGATIIAAVAAFVHRMQPYLVARPPEAVPARYIGRPPLTLMELSLAHAAWLQSAAPASPDAWAKAGIRTIQYTADFDAGAAIEGADGDLYLSYYWDRGTTPYQPDSVGVLTGGAIRPIFAGEFLDYAALIWSDDGFPEFVVDTGSTPHESPYFGTWKIEPAGPLRVSTDEITTPSDIQLPCRTFDGGSLCRVSGGVRFTRGAVSIDIPGASLVGGGSTRFLLSVPSSTAKREYLEGFAPRSTHSYQ